MANFAADFRVNRPGPHHTGDKDLNNIRNNTIVLISGRMAHIIQTPNITNNDVRVVYEALKEEMKKVKALIKKLTVDQKDWVNEFRMKDELLKLFVGEANYILG